MGFRSDFVWGAATASVQVEGAAYEDGKGVSIWDNYCRENGRVADGQTCETACDHYHLFKQDVAMMKQMGLKAYRFSIAWPRILPEGTGKINEKGLDFYRRLAAELRENGIEPYATLYHWDLPLALWDKGGWLNPDSPIWFADYTRAVSRALRGSVKNFITFNEPQCFIGLGCRSGEQAPGLKYSVRDTVCMGHHVLLAHGLAVKTIREEIPDARIGYAPTITADYPATDCSEDIEAARSSMMAMSRPDQEWTWNVPWWSDPAVLGRYPEEGLSHLGSYLPKGWERDLDTICQPLDFYGQNIYNGSPVRADGKGGFERVTRRAGYTRTGNYWPVTPQALYWGPKFLYERYQLPIVITENGMVCHDTVSLDGKVHDPNRIDFLHRYLLELKRAAEDGVDIMGYFHWSLMDNFEWGSGFRDRFGLVYVDFETQERIWKDSAFWYRTVMETNGACL